jgi:outer membrane beta-barrel protein
MAVLNNKVLHFEAFLLGGGSVVKINRADGFRPAANVGLGMRLFKGDTVSFRLDVTNNVVFTGTRNINNVLSVQLGTAFNFGATE